MAQKQNSPISAKSGFSKAAIDYVDTLLEAQAELFSATTALRDQRATRFALPAKPSSSSYDVEFDSFRGFGWSDVAYGRAHTPYRWMGRVATLMVYNQLSAGGRLQIDGFKVKRRRFLKGLTIWMDDYPVTGTVKRTGLSSWQFTGDIPALDSDKTAFHLLRFESPGHAKLSSGEESPHVSLGVSRIKIEPHQ
ncbi:hypothetical protein GCM10017044_11200 [Kordiimonas sediminis]|uniref:Uncharacterized protein n=1 Tax=Kordiimonas sediminis TaxID=1735581 RepID=A0A919ANE3_9PROT|nr:hypothetical protein [Kordiimonas sediminis]GHF18436.1 hypothetical protein GCM10017044_11200 [Kordiimonas sediminis]